MSSISFPYSRKRLHSPDFRDNSEDEDEAPPPPVKIKKKESGNKIPVAFANRLRQLAVWVSELPVKNYFMMSVKAGATLPEENINMADEDVITIDEDLDGEPQPNPFLQRFHHSQHQMSPNRGRLSRPPLEVKNGSCTTRLRTRENEVSCTYDSRFDSGNPVIGASNNGARHKSNGNYNLRPQPFLDKSLVPITNPASDVEILLDAGPKTSTPEPEIEIISEPPNLAQKAASCRPIRASGRTAIRSSAPIPGPSQRPTRALTALSKSYTAHEVVRLQEKEQYQLLLQKYIHGNSYNGVSKKQKSESKAQASAASLEFSGSHFKKETLYQPVNNFLEKYCKPCQLVKQPQVQSKETQQNGPIEITIDDDDDEMEIVDVKMPKHESSYKVNPNFFSASWIAELKKSVGAQTQERLKIVQEHEKQLERFKKERLLEQLKIDEPTEPEFPELTSEIEEIVDKALVGDPEERLCKDIHRKDIETLSGLSWLNDLVINSYFDLIVERSKTEGHPSVHAYNTFFYTTYKTKGYTSVRRWTRKFDIFSYDLNFVPIHLGVHWCLGVIDHRSKKICYYDSMGSGEDKCLDLLHDYLCMEHKDKKNVLLDPSSYSTEVMKDIPQQMNGSDCGMFTLKYAEYISRDAEISFSQKDMHYFRRRMVYELITSQLL